jgi:diguanylate cyclase (GGDEF)-like protein
METLLVVDIRTIILAIFLGHIATIGILAVYHPRDVLQRIYWEFLLGRFLQAVAWVFLWGRDVFPDIYSVFIGNSILFAGFAFEALALITVDSPNRRIRILYAALTGICILSFWKFATAPNLYVGIASLVTVAIFSVVSFSLLYSARHSYLRWTLGILYALFSLFLLFRAYFGFSISDFSLLSANIIQSLSFLSMYLLMILGSTGFLLLLREQMDTRLMEANRDLAWLSRVDSLTGLYNRRAFDQALEEAIREGRRRAEPLSLLMIDVDHFKNYNDQYGHGMGDECLKTISQQIQSWCQRPGDCASRYGGDEFAVILSGTGSAGALIVAENIRKSIYDLAVLHPDSDVSDRVTVSLGVFTEVPVSAAQNEAYFIAEADQRLYTAKKSGRNVSSSV